MLIPDTQVCCGALHAHSGEMDTVRQLARTNVEVFREARVDYVISNAGGCGALLVEYDHLLHEDPKHSEAAKWLAERVVDISQLLVNHGRIPSFADPKASPSDPVTITYQDSCHMRERYEMFNRPAATD